MARNLLQRGCQLPRGLAKLAQPVHVCNKGQQHSRRDGTAALCWLLCRGLLFGRIDARAAKPKQAMCAFTKIVIEIKLWQYGSGTVGLAAICSKQ